MTMLSDGMLLGVDLAPSLMFVGISAIYETSGVKTWPAGAQAGDIAALIAVGLSGNVSAAGFTSVTGDAFSHGVTSFAYRVLTSGDISSPPSITVPNFGHFQIVIYRGPTALAKKTNAQSTTASVVVSGFTKALDSKFVLGAAFDREDSGTLPSAPSGFSTRASARSTYYAAGVYDMTSAAYGGGSVTFGLIAGSYSGSGTLLELT